ncbi:hypothetical protein E1B28_010655 [Marasmius oreades]|uniref:Uncharacterized protein n=1 Tax=Marasmius oreades TaxID=181124 RepID=A0A9P7RXP9_9AGAR|nr:uncharacterized protein E1B28_010655 [Marasmius oreades]KAG7091634.1 hypothetical protein E1B28_010655 [Marasmius oreades]
MISISFPTLESRLLVPRNNIVMVVWPQKGPQCTAHLRVFTQAEAIPDHQWKDRDDSYSPHESPRRVIWTSVLAKGTRWIDVLRPVSWELEEEQTLGLDIDMLIHLISFHQFLSNQAARQLDNILTTVFSKGS